MERITIRPLEASEWPLFRDFRLMALKAAPGVFLSSYEKSLAHSDAYWQELIGGPEHRTFGLFDGEKLIGITGAFADKKEDPSGQTATLAMSFIVPEYRGRKLSRLLYEARLDWIRAQPQFKRVLVAHRGSNEVSKRANQAYGFTLIEQSSRTWPDGTVDDDFVYELKL